MFHVVTDKVNCPAVKAWFCSHPPGGLSVDVSSYSQLHSVIMSDCVMFISGDLSSRLPMGNPCLCTCSTPDGEGVLAELLLPKALS